MSLNAITYYRIATRGREYALVETCRSCPEQYNVYLGASQAGYLRLRHGFFRADVPICGGKTIYQSEPKGDGGFYDDERERYLREAINAIDAHLYPELK